MIGFIITLVLIVDTIYFGSQIAPGVFADLEDMRLHYRLLVAASIFIFSLPIYLMCLGHFMYKELCGE